MEWQNYFKKMHDSDVMLTYKGKMTISLINTLLEDFESQLKCIENDLRTRKKLYNILIECLQNIVHHQETDDTSTCESQMSLLLLTSEEKGYCLRTGNMVANHKVHELKGWLDVVNSFSPEELRKSYIKILDKGTYSVKGTAGLGFIDIARKSGQKMKYAFQKLNDRYSIFSLNITVPRKFVYS